MIENERKLLLNCEDPISLLRSLKKEDGAQTSDITQGYLSGSARIRHVVDHNPSVGEKHLFTYKTKVSGSTVEIETEISVHDYHKLFLVVKPIIHKTRIKFRTGDYTWDIDFFKTPKSGNIYLSMAEVEMPEFELEVPPILDVLAPYAGKWIDASDKRFNNRNLANVKKVTRLYKELVAAT